MVDIEIQTDAKTVTVNYDGTNEDETVRVIGRENDRIELDSMPPIEQIRFKHLYANPLSPTSDNPVPRTPLVNWMLTHESVPTLPVARRLGDGTFEVLDGNRRLASARAVDHDTIAVHPINVDDWEALRYWAKDHFPSTDSETSDGMHLDREQQWERLEQLLSFWDEEELRRCSELAAALNRFEDRLDEE